MKIVATTLLPAVDHPNADRWNAARSRQFGWPPYPPKVADVINERPLIVFLTFPDVYFIRTLFQKSLFLNKIKMYDVLCLEA